MSHRVIKFCLKTLSDAQVLLVPAHDQHFACREFHSAAVIVGEGRRHQVPLAVLVVFECGRRHKVGGVSSNDCRLAIQQ